MRGVVCKGHFGSSEPGAHPPPPASGQSHPPPKDVRQQPFLPPLTPTSDRRHCYDPKTNALKKNQNVSNVAFQKPVSIPETTAALYQGQKRAWWSLRVRDKEEPVWTMRRQLHKIVPVQSWMGPPGPVGPAPADGGVYHAPFLTYLQ